MHAGFRSLAPWDCGDTVARRRWTALNHSFVRECICRGPGYTNLHRAVFQTYRQYS
ncbi:hypothetical protein PGR6_33320 [Pseudomonas sp. GR 6-02]|nr:hypothetical protein PGR6_33320 [Pseudomonas sp. GR 6-02]